MLFEKKKNKKILQHLLPHSSIHPSEHSSIYPLFLLFLYILRQVEASLALFSLAKNSIPQKHRLSYIICYNVNIFDVYTQTVIDILNGISDD